MSDVFKKYEGIIESAKDFDTFLKTKISRKTELEIEVSQRLSVMISEADKVLSEKLSKFNEIVDVENSRLVKLSHELNLREKAVTKQEGKYRHDSDILLEAISKHNENLRTFALSVEEYKQRKERLKQDKETFGVLQNSANILKQSLDQKEKNLISCKNDLDSLANELKSRLERVVKREQEVSSINIESQLKEIELQKEGLLKLSQEIDRKKVELQKLDEEITLKRKNLNDKERNLDNYKLELEIQWGKFRKEVEDARTNK